MLRLKIKTNLHVIKHIQLHLLRYAAAMSFTSPHRTHLFCAEINRNACLAKLSVCICFRDGLH